MRKLTSTCVFLALLSFAWNTQAAELKVGFFDLNAVAQASDAYKVKNAELQKEFESEGKTLDKQNTDLQKKINDFQVQQQALSPEAREDRQIDLARQKRDLDDKMNNYMRKRQTAERRANDEINRVIGYAASAYGKRESFSFILEQNIAGVAWMNEALDVTKQVLAESNRVWKDKPKEVFGTGK